MRAVVRRPLPCVQWLSHLSNRPLKAGQLFSAVSSGISPCSGLGGMGQGDGGRRSWGMNVSRRRGLVTDSLSCVKHLPCFSVFSSPVSESCAPSCSSIWFNFREMFIFLSKCPFITLGMGLDVLLVGTRQKTMPLEGMLLRPHTEPTQLSFWKCIF